METKKVTVDADRSRRTMDFRFKIASKGGGVTAVALEIGVDDFSTILGEMANQFSEDMGFLTEVASTVHQRNLEHIAEARSQLEKQKSILADLGDELDTVENFVTKKWLDAPTGKDQSEGDAYNAVMELVTNLRVFP